MPCLLCGEVLGARRFVQPADPSPYVQFPSEAESCLEIGDVRIGSRREWPRAAFGYPNLSSTGGSHDHRQAFRAHDPELLTGLQYPLSGDFQIEVLNERGANGLGHRVALEQIEPVQVCQ